MRLWVGPGISVARAVVLALARSSNVTIAYYRVRGLRGIRGHAPVEVWAELYCLGSCGLDPYLGIRVAI